jgi:mucosal vascular addressin cell adhesion protein 1
MWLLPLFPQSLSSTVTLEHSSLPPGVNISYKSQCGGPEKKKGEAGEARGQCNHVRINQTVRASQDR